MNSNVGSIHLALTFERDHAKLLVCENVKEYGNTTANIKIQLTEIKCQNKKIK
jgi:hypothetical protein